MMTVTPHPVRYDLHKYRMNHFAAFPFGPDRTIGHYRAEFAVMVKNKQSNTVIARSTAMTTSLLMFLVVDGEEGHRASARSSAITPCFPFHI